jgi:hypothetical protein
VGKKVFILHSRADETLRPALEIARSLEDMGLDVWLDQKDIKPGDSISNAITNALEQSSYVVALVSPGDQDSPYYQKELEATLAKGKPILPVMINNATSDNLPELIKDRLPVNYSNNPQSLRPVYDVIDEKRSFWSKFKEYLVNE